MNPTTSAKPMEHEQMQHHNNYPRFLLMLGISFVVMYVVMYLNTYSFDHVYFSLTRFYMTLLMITTMALMMLFMMPKMYTNKTLNGVIAGASLTVFVAALVMVRAQTFVDEVSWMKAMIPHHSIAILTSGRAHIEDPEVRKLADNIIATQKREIGEMQQMLKRLDK